MTAEQWVSKWRIDESLCHWRYDELELENRFKQIQLDAMKEGMRRAAKITFANTKTGHGVKGIHNLAVFWIYKAILTAAEQLNEKDL